MSRTPFIGIGTGRCGTKSLARLLDACKRTDIGHEQHASQWYVGDSKSLSGLVEVLAGGNGELRGEVGAYLIPHVPTLVEAVPGLKIVVLERDKQETVDSFMAWCPGSRLRPQDKIAEQDHPQAARRIACLPMIDAASAEQSWGFYWDMCKELVRGYEKNLSAEFLHVDVGELNDDGQLLEIMQFVGIPSDDRVVLTKRKHNSFEEVMASVS